MLTAYQPGTPPEGFGTGQGCPVPPPRAQGLLSCCDYIYREVFNVLSLLEWYAVCRAKHGCLSPGYFLFTDMTFGAASSSVVCVLVSVRHSIATAKCLLCLGIYLSCFIVPEFLALISLSYSHYL